MTPRYGWTPASETPDTDRDVLVWRQNEDGLGKCEFGKYYYGVWNVFSQPQSVHNVTHWRDVEPPKDSA